MQLLQVGQKVKANHPQCGGVAYGEVLFNTLRGAFPVLIKLNVKGDEICVQTDATGSGFVEAMTNAVACVSYVFADGSATRLAPADAATTGGRVAVGAMKANRLDDGTYAEFEFVSFEDEAETEKASTETGFKIHNLTGGDIPKEVKDALEKIFGLDRK